MVCLRTTPMDGHGFFNFSGRRHLSQGGLRARAKLLIVETSPSMPYVFGCQESVHVFRGGLS